MLSRWKDLAFFLIVKYNDMIVKPDINGQFKRTPEGVGDKVSRPGYPEPFRKILVNETGTRYEYPADK